MINVGYVHYTDIFTDSQMELFKKDIHALIYHMSNDIVNKQKLATDEIMNNIHNSVSIIYIYKIQQKKMYIIKISL